jgi:hypothetical protein
MQGDSIVAMSKQVEQFDALRCNISARISKEGADNVLSRSLFLLSTGGNDIFAFFSANSTPTPAQKQLFTAHLVSQYINHVKVHISCHCYMYEFILYQKKSSTNLYSSGLISHWSECVLHGSHCTIWGRGSSP